VETFRVYRVADLNDDGDMLDRGETTVAYQNEPHGAAPLPGWGGSVASRIDRSRGRPQRQLVITSIGRTDRISLVDEDGTVTDIGRSFPGGFNDVYTSPNGDIYPVVEEFPPGQPSSRTHVYRLAAGRSDAPAVRDARPKAFDTPSGSRPLLVVASGMSSSTAWVDLNGSTVREVRHVGDLCRASAGARSSSPPTWPFPESRSSTSPHRDPSRAWSPTGR
jgi:hypothetical protein